MFAMYICITKKPYKVYTNSCSGSQGRVPLCGLLGSGWGVSNRWTRIWNGMVDWNMEWNGGLEYGMEQWNGKWNGTVNVHSYS